MQKITWSAMLGVVFLSSIIFGLFSVRAATAKEFGPFGPFYEARYALAKKNFAFYYQDAQGQTYVRVRDNAPLGPYRAAGLYPAVSDLAVTDDGWAYIYSQLDNGVANLYVNVNGVITKIYDRYRYAPSSPRLLLTNQGKWLAVTDQIAWVKFSAGAPKEIACSPSASQPCVITSIGLSPSFWAYAFYSYHDYNGYIIVSDNSPAGYKKLGPFYAKNDQKGLAEATVSVGQKYWLASYYDYVGRNGYEPRYGYVLLNGQVAGPFKKVNYIQAKDNVYIYCYTTLQDSYECKVNGKVYANFGAQGNFSSVIDGDGWALRSLKTCLINGVRSECTTASLADKSYVTTRSDAPQVFMLNGKEYRIDPAGARLNSVLAGGTNWAYTAFPQDPWRADYCAIVNLNGVSTKIGDSNGCQVAMSLTGSSYALRYNYGVSGRQVYIKAGLDFSNSKNVQPALAGVSGPVCGNGKREALEECDIIDLAKKTCKTFGFYGGALRCNANCKLDTSGCYNLSACADTDAGDNPYVKGQAKQLIGSKVVATHNDLCLSKTQLREFYCAPQSSAPGWSVQNRIYDCDCVNNVCVATADQQCRRLTNGRLDTVNNVCYGNTTASLKGKTCKTLGFSGGTLSCAANCIFDIGKCYKCGDNKIDQGEKCDLHDLGLASCESLGFYCGQLKCSDNCQGFDTSACKSNRHECPNLPAVP